MIILCCGRWFYAIMITGDQPNHPWSCWTEIHRLWMQTEGQQNVFFIEFFLAEKDCHQNVFYSDKPPCVPSERVECSATILWLWVVEERAGEGQQDRGARPAQQGHQAPASLPWRRRWFVTSWSLFLTSVTNFRHIRRRFHRGTTGRPGGFYQQDSWTPTCTERTLPSHVSTGLFSI